MNDLKMHLVSISYRGKSYPMFVYRPKDAKKVEFTLDEIRATYPDLTIYEGLTIAIY